mmetsp:Transcript_7802/g.14760  ORF Transcript_7802/g.14760 Transcript_7802/m.14760 type:complete len:220 (-) Transcript_7802:613-1272(-)
MMTTQTLLLFALWRLFACWGCSSSTYGLGLLILIIFILIFIVVTLIVLFFILVVEFFHHCFPGEPSHRTGDNLLSEGCTHLVVSLHNLLQSFGLLLVNLLFVIRHCGWRKKVEEALALFGLGYGLGVLAALFRFFLHDLDCNVFACLPVDLCALSALEDGVVLVNHVVRLSENAIAEVRVRQEVKVESESLLVFPEVLVTLYINKILERALVLCGDLLF